MLHVASEWQDMAASFLRVVCVGAANMNLQGHGAVADQCRSITKPAGVQHILL